jgi:hypothetical protein
LHKATMTRRHRLLWKVLLALFVTCTFATLAAWAVLLSTLCSNPHKPVPETGHIVSYSCHGMTVFISQVENTLLHWLIPIEMVFILLSLFAAVRGVLCGGKLRIDVKIDRKRTGSGQE